MTEYQATHRVARTVDRRVLAKALRRAEVAGRAGVLVFDLDSTLLDNRPRQVAILREFGVAQAVDALAHSEPRHWVSWDLRDAMRNAGVDDATVERLAEEAKVFWRERFFTSEYCRLDEAVAGARDYLHAVRNTGARIAYCTGRHEAMRDGTVDNLGRLGMPLPDGVTVDLLMKPTFTQDDDDWKIMAYDRLRALGQVLAAFDNEPTHINGYRVAFPDAIMVHLATDHSGRPVTLLDGIVSVEDFRL